MNPGRCLVMMSIWYTCGVVTGISLTIIVWRLFG